MEFLGLSNVVDADPIINEKDGLTDGFVIRYYEIKNGKRIDKKVTKYIREYDFNSAENDGSLHGFGRGTVYVRAKKSVEKSSKKVMKKKGIIVDKKILSSIKIK